MPIIILFSAIGLCGIALDRASASPATVALAEQDWARRSQPGVAQAMLSSLEQASRTGTSDGEVLWRLARAYWWMAARYSTDKADKLDLLTKAKTAAEEGAKLSPKNPDAHYWHAVAIAQSGKIRGILQSLFMVKPCKEALDKALALDPGHAASHYLMAELLSQVPGPPISIGNKQKALEEARLAVKFDPAESSHHLVLAKCLLANKQNAEARGVLEYVLNMPADPADPEGLRLDKEEARELLATIKG